MMGTAVAASEADRARIAIGLSLLKFKPPLQSYASYALEIQAKFLLTTTRSFNTQEVDSWRQRTLELEKQLQESRDQYERDYVRLHSPGDKQARPFILVESGSGIVPKKKPRKKLAQSRVLTGPASPPSSLVSILNQPSSNPDIFTTQNSPSLFSSLDALRQLLESTDDSPIPMDVLLSASHRVLSNIRPVVLHLLPPHPTQPSSVKILLTLSDLLPCLLASLLPPLLTESRSRQKSAQHVSAVKACPVREIVTLVITTICVPLIQAFVPLSVSYASNVFSKGHDGTNDIRNEVLRILKKTMIALFQHTALVDSNFMIELKELLALEALRELKRIYPRLDSQDSVGSLSDGNHLPLESTNEQMIGLGHKDAMWYLSVVIRLAMTPGNRTVPVDRRTRNRESTGAGNGLFKGKILEILSDLLRQSEECNSGKADLEPEGGSQRKLTRGAKIFGEIGHNVMLTAAASVWEHEIANKIQGLFITSM